jgi:hypothetical protein
VKRSDAATRGAALRRSHPILLLARSIGNVAPKINDALTEAVHSTAPLGALRTTIEYAGTIIGGLQRGRARLGDDNA